MGRRRGGRASVLATGLLLAVGCGGPEDPPAADGAAPAAAAPAPVYERSWTGALSRTYDGDYEACVAATKAALGRLGLAVTSESGDVFRRTVEAETADGTSTAVLLSSLTKATTRITVKVGFLLGSADAAQRVHSEIEAALGTRREATDAMRRKWGAGGAGAPPAERGAP